MKKLFYSRMLCVVIISVMLINCKDSSTGPDEFTEPYQVEIVSQNFVLATATTAITAGAFTFQPGVEFDVEINFLNKDGNLLEPLEGEFVQVTVDDPAIGTFTLDSEGAFTGNIKALTTGSTTVEFRYMYGGVGSSNAKASFVSAKINFIVGDSAN